MSEHTLLHRVLVLSGQAARIPRVLALLSLLVLAGLTGLVWSIRLDSSAGWAAGGLVLAACLLNWAALEMLPLAGRSFGPAIPPALALSALLAVGSLCLALLLPHLLLLAVGLAGVTLVAVYATWIAPFRLEVTAQRLITTQLTRPLRLIHVGDLHVERATGRERRVNALLRSLNPDVIVFSGDFVNITYRNDARAEAGIRALLADWRAPQGVFAVPGTPLVEPLPRVQAFVQSAPGITLLLNEWQTIPTPAGALHIAGLITTHDLTVDRAALAELARQKPADGLTLLLTHSPDVAPEAAEAGFDLMLSGHTHGGQIVLPLVGPLFSGSAYGRRFLRGRHALNPMTLYVTRGLGMEGWGAPRARLFCRPELTVWTIGPAA